MLLVAQHLQADLLAKAEDFASLPASRMIFDIINRSGHGHRNVISRTPWPLTWRITGPQGALPARSRQHRLARNERAPEP
jgi:hypothetical protein